MTILTIDQFLSHYGVKGMRWGVRRSERQLRKAAEAKEKQRISDDALREAVGRMRLEKEYRQLMSELNPAKVNRGRKFAVELLGKVASEQLTRVAKAGAAVQVEKMLLGEKTSIEDIGKRLRPDVYNTAGEKKSGKSGKKKK